MFGLGLPELIVILVIALIVVGPGKLPQAGAAIGKALGELRAAMNKTTLADAVPKEEVLDAEAKNE